MQRNYVNRTENTQNIPKWKKQEGYVQANNNYYNFPTSAFKNLLTLKQELANMSGQLQKRTCRTVANYIELEWEYFQTA